MEVWQSINTTIRISNDELKRLVSGLAFERIDRVDITDGGISISVYQFNEGEVEVPNEVI